MLDAALPLGEQREMLEQMGVEPTYAALILSAVVRRASEKADMDSLRFIRDTLAGPEAEEAPESEHPAGGDRPKARPVRSLELEKLSDAELAALADQTDDEDA